MSKIKVLIVEDEAIISEYLARHLEKSGYQITGIVESGKHALQSIEKNLPDIVIMDIELEGEVDGIQTTEEINKNLKLPVIYLTKLTDKPTFKRALQTYPASYLVKPFNEVDLVNTIEITLFNASCIENINNVPNDTSDNPFFSLENRVFIKNSKNHLIKVEINDINYIEGDGSYSKIYTKSGNHNSSYSLKVVLEKISHPDLIRIHRSYIINLNKIVTVIGKKKVIINLKDTKDFTIDSNQNPQEPTKNISIGEEYKDNFFKMLKRI